MPLNRSTNGVHYSRVKRSFFFSVMVLLFSSFQQVKGQQLLNGNMEDWDTAYYPYYPESWLTNSFYASLPCSPQIVTAEKSSDSYEGNWSVKLETKVCGDDMGQAQIYVGFLAYGSTSYPYWAHGIPYNGKPDKLSFYYKFHKEGNDTAFASIKLRLLDSVGAGQVIGQGRFPIISEITEYTQADVLITYISSDTPQLIQIVFSTSKTLTDKEFFSINTLYDAQAQASVGSTLWVDSVGLLWDTLSDISVLSNHSNIAIFPIPAKNIIYLKAETPIKANLCLINLQGGVVIQKEIQNLQEETLDVSECSSGIYFLKIETSTESIIRKIVVQ